ncbi:MAG: hypothetical protein KC449_10015 [Anaerolineales bacterium]|nr:hypothetical protein [Anaerolineales bacterium]
MKQQLQDDLTAVKGIGPARQRWLAELFDVFTFEALGQLPITATEEAARQAGKILPKGELASWVAQAKALAAAKSSEANVAAEEKMVVETAVPQPNPFWKPIASFVVEFQERDEAGRPQRRTKVHYMEADMEMNWPGIAREELGLWIEQHVQLSESAPEPVAAARPVVEEKLSVQPAQVRLRQQPNFLATLDMDHPARPFLGHVHHQEPITLEVDFNLEASDKDHPGLPPEAYSAHCEMQNLTAGQKTVYLEMKGDLSANRLTYKTRLTDVEPGMYRLGVLVRAERPLSTTYFDLPMLNIL